MIIYNVTTNIHESVHDKWMIWMQHKHIPEMLAQENSFRQKWLEF